jgi:hypothetical protein
MKKTLLIALASTFILTACHKIDDQQANQQADQTQQTSQATTAPVNANPTSIPASASNAQTPPSVSAVAPTVTQQNANMQSVAEEKVGIFGDAFDKVIKAVKQDTANGVIPPTPDDAFINNELKSLTDEERLNLFKVIYIRAASSQGKTSTALTPDSFNATTSNVGTPSTASTPGDQVLQGLNGH